MRLKVALLWLRLGSSCEAAVAAWRGGGAYPVKTPRKRQRLRQLGAVVRKLSRWLNDHLVQMVAWTLMLALGVLLMSRIEKARETSDSLNASIKELVLLGLVVGLAVLAQLGHRLLHRLKKVGPVEFIERRYDQIAPELPEILVDLDGPKPPLSAKLLWEYEKAEIYVTHLEWAGLEGSGVAGNERFHDLLFKMSAIALMRDYLPRAVDRLELLLKISEGEFKCADAHYRCGIAYRKLATKEEDQEKLYRERQQKKEEEHHRMEKLELCQKAQTHLRKASEEDPYLHQAFFNLAFVQFVLREYPLAIANNEATLEILPRYALANYNLAICHIKMEQMKEARNAVKRIRADDKGARAVHDDALHDGDFARLLADPIWGREVREHLETLKPNRR